MTTAGTEIVDLARLRHRVQAEIDEEIALRAAQLAAVGRDTRLLVDAVADLLRGGKRLRAAFCYWGYRAAGGDDNEAIVRAATAMELFQAAALLHDDVMDDSDTRRGMPAAHRRLAAHHADQRWEGLSERFGVAGAILAGNLCLTWTDSMFATSGLSRQELHGARPIFDEMRTQLMGGQFLDVLEAARGWSDLTTEQRLARAHRVITYKSAKYSVEHPLLIGAAAAGARHRDLQHLGEFGLCVGQAFQLRDDLLGVFGDPAATGKPAGDDLREGKQTVLVAHTLEGLGRAEAAAFARRLGDPHLEERAVAQMRDAIVSSGAVDAVERDIDRLLEQALVELAATQGLLDDGRAVLADLATYATQRAS
ncbi:polyprenyl synthetase family protein [Arsenicicoccus sp. oral taxon 190]|uniref:polyprenyl synthetase family protein n=1 Tax=Arsenicicoccus sp. oral taxon 190 TaxID=1658671 RepID=UPI000679FE04|nr:polyprenyl synthetase family protein [Arsenicicoccus sp. oral taxon 190]AKT52037.1 polyprenyl synthetase [Arsenicicoccus sp. oral taxon 190]